jgi:SAM-dependent methyltransferase
MTATVEDHYVSLSQRTEMGCAHRRFRNGENRADIFCELITNTIKQQQSDRSGQDINVLDIGCGSGIDNCGGIRQQKIRDSFSGRFIGIEPDESMKLLDSFDETHRTFLEDSGVQSNSVHVAYSNFVLEHIPNPKPFWEKLYDVMDDGGVFWGFTIDARHPFSLVSSTMDQLKVKDMYLTMVRGRRGEDRYNNYPAYYRANSPRQVIKHCHMFKSAKFCSLNKVGMLAPYFPGFLKPLANLSERVSMALRMPGIQFLVRLEK